jgi:PleD family two-component response regulator
MVHMKQWKILVVDDDEATTASVVGSIEAIGCDVTVLRQSALALSTLYENPWRFDLVIADEAMDDLPGSALAARILAVREALDIILLTERNDGEAASRAKALGVQCFIAKPVVREELIAGVRQVLSWFGRAHRARGMTGCGRHLTEKFPNAFALA